MCSSTVPSEGEFCSWSPEWCSRPCRCRLRCSSSTTSRSCCRCSLASSMKRVSRPAPRPTPRKRSSCSAKAESPASSPTRTCLAWTGSRCCAACARRSSRESGSSTKCARRRRQTIRTSSGASSACWKSTWHSPDMRRADSTAPHIAADRHPFEEIDGDLRAALHSKSERIRRDRGTTTSQLMSFRARLFAFLALTGVLPVALLGWLSFSVHRAEVERTVSRTQSTIAAEAARNVERTVASGIEGLRLSVGALPLDQLSNDELAAVLRIPYRQLSFVNAVALLDADANLLAPPVYEQNGQKPDGFAHPDLQALLTRVPVSLLERSDTALGVPYRGSTGTTRVPVAMQLGRGRVLAAELSLKGISSRLAELPGTAFLAGQNGAVLAGVTELSSDEKQLVAGAIASHAPLARLVRRPDGSEWLAAAAPVGTVGWAVAVAQPAAAAFNGAVRVRVYTVFWAAVALVLTGVLGMLLARGLSAPVRELSQGVRALAEGRYDQTVAVESRDELGQLADGFNHMVRE